MFDALTARLSQGYRTGGFPPAQPNLPAHFIGRPQLAGNIDATAANKTCPTCAFCKTAQGDDAIDTGKCLFCGKCAAISPAIEFTREFRLGAMKREDLLASKERYSPAPQHNALISKLCGRSLKIRQVSAGGCAACELDFNVLNTLAWDMGRFGIQAVASPRHADAILVTGPVTRNMLTALRKTYEAMPKPCFVIASGACAISGGLYADSQEIAGPVDKIFPVALYVPGCPPHPAVLLEALIRFMKR